MSYLATTRASVYRGTTENPAGDEIDDNTTPVAGMDNLRASLIEKTRKVYDPAAEAQRTVRWCVGRFDAGTDIRGGDRIRDNRSGKLYALDESTDTKRTIAGTSELVLDLRILPPQ